MVFTFPRKGLNLFGKLPIRTLQGVYLRLEDPWEWRMAQKTMKILFIDEKRITSELEKAGYRKIGAQIVQATNFTGAKDILKKEEIDVIVLNFDYAQIDAPSICEHFKKQKDTAEIPIVFTSVQSLPKKVMARTHAPDLFIETPVPREYFIEKIRSILDEKTRNTERVTHVGEAEYIIDGESFHAPIQDVSKSGILLATDSDLKVGTKVTLNFELPGYKKPITVDGEVVRQIAPNKARETPAGIGIRFDEFNGDSQKRLEKYIAKSQNDDPKLAYYL
jgi:uncharacterized protein (TIGR02266 family)